MQLLPIAKVTLSAGVLRAYERSLDALGGVDFEATVLESFQDALAWRRLYLFEGPRPETSVLRVARYESDLEPMVPLYVRKYLRHDPIGHAMAAMDEGAEGVILRLQPSDIAEEGYRRAFFEDRGIVERVSLLQRGPRGWRGANIARHRREGPCTSSDIEALCGLAQLLLPLVERHFEPRAATPWRKAIDDIEARFLRDFPALTGREREVCARAAVGMSVEATALDLGIGEASVLTYRRRAYRRLNVSSPYGLAALVLH